MEGLVSHDRKGLHVSGSLSKRARVCIRALVCACMLVCVCMYMYILEGKGSPRVVGEIPHSWMR